jgi:hypothetical protein
MLRLGFGLLLLLLLLKLSPKLLVGLSLLL